MEQNILSDSDLSSLVGHEGKNLVLVYIAHSKVILIVLDTIKITLAQVAVATNENGSV